MVLASALGLEAVELLLELENPAVGAKDGVLDPRVGEVDDGRHANHGGAVGPDPLLLRLREAEDPLHAEHEARVPEALRLVGRGGGGGAVRRAAACPVVCARGARLLGRRRRRRRRRLRH
ncbi:Os08g0163850 [Oryza sativa Japonica Group]|uniref:Os08g0163850 protein n=2 Tax=Oryza sativa subsp. japonica TaxID=39947 RepID=C7J663_ORYSJ|nr:Os08g0163850 [Oryza sativa Japonica Group]BAT03969.1 Os08g0163850 [Oryza sativa Japonica Group]|eukprot:NP_001175395.1 Os08g0163850 [Oryza sativa Japonica Group]